MLSTVDIFYLVVGASIAVLSGFASYAFFQIAQTVKEARSVVVNVKDTTNELQALKNNLTLGVLKLFKNVVGENHREEVRYANGSKE